MLAFHPLLVSAYSLPAPPSLRLFRPPLFPFLLPVSFSYSSTSLFISSSSSLISLSQVAMTKFGDFAPLCHDTPSYPWCNLFYRQLQHHASNILTGVSSNSQSAPVGVNPNCGIPRVGNNGSLANIANIIACGLSIFVVGALIVDRKSTRLNSSHSGESRMPSSA